MAKKEKDIERFSQNKNAFFLKKLMLKAVAKVSCQFKNSLITGCQILFYRRTVGFV